MKKNDPVARVVSKTTTIQLRPPTQLSNKEVMLLLFFYFLYKPQNQLQKIELNKHNCQLEPADLVRSEHLVERQKPLHL